MLEMDQLCRKNDVTDSASTGLFFFALALFGFSCLSILGIFANERLLFMRERCVAHG